MVYENIAGYMRSTHPQSDVRVYRKDPIVTVEDNYDNLLIAADNISRSSTYTHYVDKTHMLRTHTSAHLPGILRELAGQGDLGRCGHSAAWVSVSPRRVRQKTCQ